jgi:hypothetical protein
MALCGAIAGALYSKETLFREVEQRRWGFQYFHHQRERYPNARLQVGAYGGLDLVGEDGIAIRSFPEGVDRPPHWYSYLSSVIPVMLGLILGWGVTHSIAWVIEGFVMNNKRGRLDKRS